MLKNKPTHDKKPIKAAGLQDRLNLDEFDANPTQNPYLSKAIPKLNDPTQVRKSELPVGLALRREGTYPPPKEQPLPAPVEDPPVATPGIYDNIRNMLANAGINLPDSLESAGTQIGNFFRNASNRVSDFFGYGSGGVKTSSVSANVVAYVYLDKLAQDTKLPKTFLEKLANALRADHRVFVKEAYAKPELFFSVVRYFGAPKQVKSAQAAVVVAKPVLSRIGDVLRSRLFKGMVGTGAAVGTGLGVRSGYNAITTPNQKLQENKIEGDTLPELRQLEMSLPDFKLKDKALRENPALGVGLGVTRGGFPWKDDKPVDGPYLENHNLPKPAREQQAKSVTDMVANRYRDSKPWWPLSEYPDSMPSKELPKNPETAGAAKPGDYSNKGFSYKNWWQDNKDWAGPAAIGAGGLTAGLGAYQLYKYLTRKDEEEEKA